jgi:hypothetical protein
MQKSVKIDRSKLLGLRLTSSGARNGTKGGIAAGRKGGAVFGIKNGGVR